MLIVAGSDVVPAEAKGAVLAIGNFDGVHRGHQALIGKAVKRAAELGTRSGVVMFEPHPREVFHPAEPHFHLTPRALKLKRLQALRETSLRSWIFFNRFVPRRRLAQEVYDKVARHFPHNLLETTINEAAVLAECAGAGKTIFEYSAKSRSAYAFRALTDDLRNGRVVGNEKETTSHVA